MRNENQSKKGLVFGIIIILVVTSIGINSVTSQDNTKGNILIYCSTDEPYPIGYPKDYFDEGLPAILQAYDYNVTVTDRITTPEINASVLENYTELWILSTDSGLSGNFVQEEINVILCFREQGHGLLIMSDHNDSSWHYNTDANQIAVPLGVNFYGSVVHGYAEPITPVFADHPLFVGVSTILGDESDALMSVNAPVEVVATYMGDNLISVLDNGDGRVVFDVSFWKFSDNRINTGDQPQYIRNIADWLSASFPFSMIYVDDDNTAGPWDGSLAHPYQHIQAGIDAVAVGGTVFVFDGIYHENVAINKNHLMLQGEEKNSTIIDASNSGNGFIIQNTNNISISEFTIRNASENGIYIYGYSDWHSWINHDFNLSNLKIYNNSANGIYVHPTGYGCRISDVQINNCEIFSNQVSGINLHADGNHCIIGESPSHTRISNCKIMDNVINGISLRAETHHSYIAATIVSNCTIQDNDGYGIETSMSGDCWNEGNIIYHNNFINNSMNAYDPYTNIWQNDTLQQGNYWSDYTGEDNDGDGIGDIPYNISGGSNQDLDPLMQPYGQHVYWTEIQKLLALDGAGNDMFGFDVSISGDTALIGNLGHEGYRGSAYVFIRTGDNWALQQELFASDGDAWDWFGVAVSIDGDTALIGAQTDQNNGSQTGSAYVFIRNGTIWTQQAKLLASDGEGGDYFGQSLCLNGDTALVGAYNDDDNGIDSGSAYVFTRTGITWTQQAKLLASDGATYDTFGHRVSIDGNTAFIGAPTDDDNGENSGSVYVFTRTGTTWTQKQKLFSTDGAAGDQFGISVSLSGDTAIIGAFLNDVKGSVYVFTRTETTWNQQAKFFASDVAANFGYSISLSGDTALIGAHGDDEHGTGSGSAYVFTRTGITWTQQAKLLASDGAAEDWFGVSVSVSGSTALIGAPLDDDNGYNSGSAYLFTKASENQPPAADFTFTPENPTTLDTISFIDSSSDNDGTITSWSWNFGDGNTSALQNPTHQYSDHTTYTAVLTVTDDDGAIDSVSKPVIVHNIEPVADFTYVPTNPRNTTVVHFTDSSFDPDGTVNAWWWDFGDEYYSSKQNPVHCYYENGIYTVTLTVTDDDGVQNTIHKTITVSPTNYPPNTPSRPSGPTTGFTKTIYTYTTNTTDPNGDIQYYKWNWGDGSSSGWIGPYGSGVLATATHKWTHAGTYQVKVKAKDFYGAESNWSPSLTVIISKI